MFLHRARGLVRQPEDAEIRQEDILSPRRPAQHDMIRLLPAAGNIGRCVELAGFSRLRDELITKEYEMFFCWNVPLLLDCGAKACLWSSSIYVIGCPHYGCHVESREAHLTN